MFEYTISIDNKIKGIDWTAERCIRLNQLFCILHKQGFFYDQTYIIHVHNFLNAFYIFVVLSI